MPIQVFSTSRLAIARQNFIDSFQHNGHSVVTEEEKSDAIFEHFNAVLGSIVDRDHKLDLHALNIPRLDLSHIDHCFSEDEIWSIVRDLPPDKAPGPDGFTGQFYRSAWSIIKQDIIQAFSALWSLDYRSFHLVNDAYMILLRKKADAVQVADYRPISLIHAALANFSPRDLLIGWHLIFTYWSSPTRACSSKGELSTTTSKRCSPQPSYFMPEELHRYCSKLTLPKLSIPSVGLSFSTFYVTWVSRVDGSTGPLLSSQQPAQKSWSMVF